MSKNDSLLASVEWNGRTMLVYGFMEAKELKKIVDDFENGIEIRHGQVEIVEGKFVSPKLLELVIRNGEYGIRNRGEFVIRNNGRQDN